MNMDRMDRAERMLLALIEYHKVDFIKSEGKEIKNEYMNDNKDEKIEDKDKKAGSKNDDNGGGGDMGDKAGIEMTENPMVSCVASSRI